MTSIHKVGLRNGLTEDRVTAAWDSAAARRSRISGDSAGTSLAYPPTGSHIVKTCYAVLLLASFSVAACVKAQPPTDTGDPLVTAPSATGGSSSSGGGTSTPATVAYQQDLAPIFASDCLQCHGGFRIDGNYRMNTYADVMRDVRAGDAGSPLVVVTQPSGSMYRYWSGNRQAKANLVFQWVVVNKALQTR